MVQWFVSFIILLLTSVGNFAVAADNITAAERWRLSSPFSNCESLIESKKINLAQRHKWIEHYLLKVKDRLFFKGDTLPGVSAVVSDGGRTWIYVSNEDQAYFVLGALIEQVPQSWLNAESHVQKVSSPGEFLTWKDLASEVFIFSNNIRVFEATGRTPKSMTSYSHSGWALWQLNSPDQGFMVRVRHIPTTIHKVPGALIFEIVGFDSTTPMRSFDEEIFSLVKYPSADAAWASLPHYVDVNLNDHPQEIEQWLKMLSRP